MGSVDCHPRALTQEILVVAVDAQELEDLHRRDGIDARLSGTLCALLTAAIELSSVGGWRSFDQRDWKDGQCSARQRGWGERKRAGCPSTQGARGEQVNRQIGPTCIAFWSAAWWSL